MKLNWRSCLTLSASLFLLFLAIHYWGNIANLFSVLWTAAWSLILGAMIAYVINILMSFYERKLLPKCRKPIWIKNRRSVCMLLSFLTLILAVVLLVRLIVPQLADCFMVLLDAFPGAIRSLYAWLDENLGVSAFLEEQIAALPSTDAEWRALLEKSLSFLVSGVGGVMNAAVSVTSTVIGSVVSLFMSIIFMINILASKEKLASQFEKLALRALGERVLQKIRHVLSVLDNCFHSYIVGQLIEALILGSLCALGMWILQLPYPLMIGALIGVMALIPIAGAYIGAAVGAIMIFSVSPIKAVVFLIFLVALQQVEGNLIYPRTVGSTLHLPGLWVLAAVTVGGGVMGVAGMIIFVPLTAALYRLLGEWAKGYKPQSPSILDAVIEYMDPAPSAAPAPESTPAPERKPHVKASQRRKK